MAGLQRIPFSEEFLSEVQGFDCGSQPWETEVSEWIKSPDGALLDVKHGASVWLYVTDAGELVGFGSLGSGKIRYPDAKKDEFVDVAVIPFLGLSRAFWGKPKDDPDGKYSVQILRDLVHEARNLPDNRPVLVLYVSEKNSRAIDLYLKEGFVEHGRPHKGNKRMILKL